MCAFHYLLHLSSFTPTPFLHGLLGLYYFLLFPHGLGHWLGKSPWPSSPLSFCYCNFSSCYTYRPTSCHSCHVSPLGFLPLFLGFHSLFTLFLPLIMHVGLLIVIPAMLAHWALYLFSWVSTAHSLYFYLLLCMWAWWLSFLPCWPIGIFTSFLGLPRPIYFTLTSSTPFLFHLSSLLGFFCRWTFCPKWVSTLRSLDQKFQIPWLCARDFNELIRSDEKFGGGGDRRSHNQM